MATNAIRQKLHNYLEVADDKKVKALYVMMQEEIEESAVEYTDDLKKELDKRYADFKKGKVKMITADESKKRIRNLLKTGRKK
jgi:putative addiction module component (TIGR02574 family)